MSEQFGSSSPLFDQRMRDMVWPEFVCSGGSVPPHGVIEVTGFELKSGGGVRFTAQSAEEKYEDRYPKWINGPVRVESGKPGRCTKLGLVIARMKKPTTDGDLAFGDWFVADEDSDFVLNRTNLAPPGAAFVYQGGFEKRESETLGVGVFLYSAVAAKMVYGKLSATLNAADDDDGWLDKPKTAKAKVCRYDHDSKELEVLEETFDASNRTNVEFAQNTFAGFIRADGEWQIDLTGC